MVGGHRVKQMTLWSQMTQIVNGCLLQHSRYKRTECHKYMAKTSNCPAIQESCSSKLVKSVA